jgi:hypothetical protein
LFLLQWLLQPPCSWSISHRNKQQPHGASAHQSHAIIVPTHCSLLFPSLLCFLCKKTSSCFLTENQPATSDTNGNWWSENPNLRLGSQCWAFQLSAILYPVLEQPAKGTTSEKKKSVSGVQENYRASSNPNNCNNKEWLERFKCCGEEEATKWSRFWADLFLGRFVLQ